MNEVTTTNNNAQLATMYPVAELRDLANAFVECGFYGFKRPAEALVLMLKARADGIDPMTAADQYSIIQGRPALKSEAILVRFQNAGGSICWKRRSDESCTLWLSHPKGGELTVTWDKERATKAKLWNKDNFQKHPAQMLAARCISEGVRALYPACLSGCYTPEEAEFFDNKPAESAAPSASPVKEEPKPAKKSVKKEKATEAEVVEPAKAEEQKIVEQMEPLQAEPVAAPEMDEAAKAFVGYMNSLRDHNKLAFDQAWGAYTEEYGCDFTAVPANLRQQVYRNMKQAIANIVAQNLNEYMEA